MPRDASPFAECEDASFPFMHLPPELRLNVWQEYSRDLKLHARVLSLGTLFIPGPRRYSDPNRGLVLAPNEFDLEFVPTKSLSAQTQGLRRIMAVHRESRAFAMSLFPDVLTIKSYKHPVYFPVYFHSGRDIVHFDHTCPIVDRKKRCNQPSRYMRPAPDTIADAALLRHAPTLNQVRNLCSLQWAAESEPLDAQLLGAFTALETMQEPLWMLTEQMRNQGLRTRGSYPVGPRQQYSERATPGAHYVRGKAKPVVVIEVY